jgi:hypothetical protein
MGYGEAYCKIPLYEAQDSARQSGHHVAAERTSALARQESGLARSG